MAAWIDLDRAVAAARAAANRHDSPAALQAIDDALAILAALPDPAAPDLHRVAAILHQGLSNARDGVWAMLYDQAFLDLDLVHALPSALAAGNAASPPLDDYLRQALEPFRGRMQRAM